MEENLSIGKIRTKKSYFVSKSKSLIPRRYWLPEDLMNSNMIGPAGSPSLMLAISLFRIDSKLSIFIQELWNELPRKQRQSL